MNTDSNSGSPRKQGGFLFALSQAAGWSLIGAAQIYKRFLSPLLPAACRFQPTCSEYFIEALKKYGPLIGLWRGIKRIGRCHPWSQGGFDPP